MAKEKSYHHIFFDLDRTLWDFDRNSSIAAFLAIFKIQVKNRPFDGL